MIDALECTFEGVAIDVRDLPLTISLEGDCRWVNLHLEPSTNNVVEPRMKLIMIKLHPNS